MTANSTSTRQLDIGKLCLMALRHAGELSEYQQLDNEKSAAARDLLEVIVDDLQNEGVMLRAMSFETVQLEAGESVVSLPASVLRITGDAMYIQADEDPDAADAEMLVRKVSQQEWHEIGAKGAVAQPTIFCEQVSAEIVQARLWPVPHEDGWVRFPVHRLLGDNDDSTKTPDLDRGASAFLLWELAHHWAASKTALVPRLGYLSGQAEKRRPRLRLGASQQANFIVGIEHRGR